MITEQKAKKYDEALEWMRELYPGLHGATKEDAEHYFPELKESEDERMRKWIIDVIQRAGFISSEYKYEAIAWLEKRKENPKSADSIPSDCVTDAKCENLHNEEGDFVFELRQIISSHRYSDIYGEYTNDEEGMASEILELCKRELEKQKEQKPAEWSEEDEEMIEGIIGDLCALKDWIIKYDTNWLANPVLKNIDKRIDWLKSLRSLPNWKPGEEQPEVDLEEEYKTWWKSISGKINVEHIMEWYMHETARHFYELGLKAKEK